MIENAIVISGAALAGMVVLGLCGIICASILLYRLIDRQ